MSVLNVMALHLIAEIFQSRSKCWTDGASDRTIPGAMQLVWLKTTSQTSVNTNSGCKKVPSKSDKPFVQCVSKVFTVSGTIFGISGILTTI